MDSGPRFRRLVMANGQPLRFLGMTYSVGKNQVQTGTGGFYICF